MLSEAARTYTKLPGEKKVYQVDLKQFLVEHEELMDDTFEVHIFEKRASALAVDGSSSFALDGVDQIMLTLCRGGSIQTFAWPRPADAQALTLMLSYGNMTDLRDDEMLVPGTKVWDATSKVASICVQGGENGKEYILYWRFRTTTQRVEEEYTTIRVFSDVVLPEGG